MLSVLEMKFAGSLRSPAAFATMTSTPLGKPFVGPVGVGMALPLRVTVGICAFGNGGVPGMGCELVDTSIVTSGGGAMESPRASDGRSADPLSWHLRSQ